MKDYAKYLIIGVAVGAGLYGVVKGAEYLIEQAKEEPVDDVFGDIPDSDLVEKKPALATDEWWNKFMADLEDKQNVAAEVTE